MTEDYDKIQAGERVKAFLNDEYVRRAFAKVRDAAFYNFKMAQTDEELRRAQAQVRVAEAFESMLMQMVEEGQLAKNA